MVYRGCVQAWLAVSSSLTSAQEIAREKAGIFKLGAPALTVPQPPDAMAALQVRRQPSTPGPVTHAALTTAKEQSIRLTCMAYFDCRKWRSEWAPASLLWHPWSSSTASPAGSSCTCGWAARTSCRMHHLQWPSPRGGRRPQVLGTQHSSGSSSSARACCPHHMHRASRRVNGRAGAR
jgi:hypothetical protein